MIRLKEQQPAPDKTRIFREATAAAAETFGPSSYLTGLSFLMTRTTEAIIATQWGTFLWSAIGILLMLTLAFRSVVLAVLAILPTLLVGRPGAGPDGLAQDQARHGHGPGGERRPGAFGRRHVSLPAPVPPRAEDAAVPATALRELPRERAGGPSFQPGRGVGFAALRASEFEPFVNFGTMVGIATAGSTLGNLVLLPACLTLGQRWRRKRQEKRETHGSRKLLVGGVGPTAGGAS